MLLENEDIKQNSTPEEQPTVVSAVTVSNTDYSMINSSIEAKADGAGVAKPEDKPKSFLTKKRLIIAIVFFVFSLLFLFLTIRYVLKLDFRKFFGAIGSCFDHKMGILWFSLLIMMAFVNVLRTFITLTPRIKKMGCHINFGEYLLFGITITFLNQITPSNLISDPYTIFWMKTHGISTSKCMSILFTNTFFWQIIQIVLITPPFIILLVNRDKMLNYTSGTFPSGKLFFWLIIIGCVIDYIALAFIYLMCVSKRFHYRMSVIFNWFKKKFHMKYHTKPEIVEKYKEKAVIKTDFYDFMKDWKTSGITFLLFVTGEILVTLSFGWSLALVQFIDLPNEAGVLVSAKVPFDFGWMFTCARLSGPANRLNLLPGGAMMYEASLSVITNALGGWKSIEGFAHLEWKQVINARETVTSNGIFVARCLTGYLPALFGIGGFITLTIQQIRLSRKGQLTTNKF